MKDISKTNHKKLARVSKELRQEKRRMGQEPDQFDRIREHLVEGKKLGKKNDRELLEKALLIYPMLCAGKTQHDIVKIIQNAGWGSHVTAYKLIKNTRKIFLFQDDINELGKRQILVEMAKRAFKKAEDFENPNAMVSAIKLIAQLENVLDHKESYTIIYKNLELPALNVTDDPQVIDMPVQEIEFEEG